MRHVKTEVCNSKEDVYKFLDRYMDEGYEGVILRNINGKYEQKKRSVNLQKLKKFLDDEFEITGFTTSEEGKEIGCVIWECVTKDGKKFHVKPKWSYEERKDIYKNGEKFIGKKLTVRYQELTKEDVS